MRFKYSHLSKDKREVQFFYSGKVKGFAIVHWAHQILCLVNQ